MLKSAPPPSQWLTNMLSVLLPMRDDGTLQVNYLEVLDQFLNLPVLTWQVCIGLLDKKEMDVMHAMQFQVSSLSCTIYIRRLIRRKKAKA